MNVAGLVACKLESGFTRMATLFDGRLRGSQEPLRPGGILFDFYDTCGRHGYDQFRDFVNTWIAELPERDGTALARQMQCGDNRQFEAGMIELVIHALLKRQGYDVTCHPNLQHTSKKPDFAVKNQEGRVLAYVEVTTNNPSKEEIAQTNNESRIQSAIDAALLPDGCRLGYRVERYGTASPSLNQLVASVEKWVRENANDTSGEKPPQRVFNANDWQIELQLFTGAQGPGNGHCIVAVSGNVRWLGPALDIRYCLERKAKRYGKLDAPYLIVVADCAEQIAFRENGVRDALTETVLGDEVFVVPLDGNGGELRRKPNGFFGWPRKPQNSHVSAVLVIPDADLWRLRHDKCQPMMAFHPWADNPISDAFLPLPNFKWVEGRWVFDGGARAADILELPDPWPPQDDCGRARE